MNPVSVTPGAPTFQSIANCGTTGSVDIPQTTGVKYTLNSNDYTTATTVTGLQGSQTVTSSALPGYVLSGTTTWTHNVGTLYPCATPSAPTFNPITACGVYGSIVIPNVTGVEYRKGGVPVSGTLSGLQGSQTITAHPVAPYDFPSGTTASWTQNLGVYTDCATPVAPTFNQVPQCGQYGSVVIHEVQGVIYTYNSIPYPYNAGDAGGTDSTIAGLSGSQTVTAAPASGYSFPTGTVTSWTADLGAFTQCVTPNAPIFVDIAQCGQYGQVNTTPQTGVSYSITVGTPGALEGNVTVEASPTAGYSFPPGAIISWTHNVGAYTSCVTPLAPTFNPIAACNALGSIDIPFVEHVVYHHNGADYPSAATISGLSGTQTVTATATAGYGIASATTKSWTQSLGSPRTCATPVEPTYVDIDPLTCNSLGQVIFASTTGVVYSITSVNTNQGVVTTKAEPLNASFELVGYTGPWSHDLGAFVACPPGDIEIPAPQEPTVTLITACNMDGSVVLPTGVDHVIYNASPSNATQGVVNVTATAESGYKFPVGATTSWSYDLGIKTTCATPTGPTFHPIQACGVMGSIDIPDDDGVIYWKAGSPVSGELTGLEGSITITATAASGYSFTSGSTTSWTENLGAYTDCATPTAPTFNPITACGDFGSIVIPTVTGVVYKQGVTVVSGTLTGLQGSKTITAEPASGYSFTAGAQTSFTSNLGVHTTCATPTAPTFNPIAQCGTLGSVVFPSVAGVSYAVTSGTGTSGVVVVTASPSAGYSFPAGAQTIFTSNLGQITTCATPLPPTFSAIASCGLFGSVAFPSITGVSYQITVGDGQEGVVTVLASPTAGFSFPTGAQTVFSFDLGDFTPCTGSIGNRVWNDSDGDGVQDAGEPGVAGVTVFLYRSVGGNPTATALMSTTTDATGAYSFTGLSTVTGLDKYFVRYVLPAGYGFTSMDVGVDGTDSDANPQTGYTLLIDLDSAENDTTEDAGIYIAALTAAKRTAFNEAVKGTPVEIEDVDVVLPYNTSSDTWQVTSKFVVTNTGTVVLAINEMVDDVLGDVECAAAGAPLNPGASITCSASAPYANDENRNTLEVAATVVGKSASILATDHATSTASSSYACRGNELYGRWYYETNETFDGFTPGEDFLFKDAPLNLVPAALKDVELPVFLSRAGLPESEAKVVFSHDGAFQFSNLEVGQGMTYTLRVGDDAFTPLGYGPVGSSLRFNILADHCTSQTFDIGYAKSGGVMGGFVWYDANKNGVKDEWFDADNDGTITLNNDAGGAVDENGFVSLPVGDYEFFDINGNGEPDLPGELNECGLRSVGPTVELFDGDNNLLDTTVAGNTGFYRFRTLVDPESGEEVPLDPQALYGLRMPAAADNPLLVTGGAEMEATGLCKSRPDVEIAEAQSIWSAGGDPAPNCGSTSVPVLVRKLVDYPGGIALDANFGVACVRDTSEPGLRTIWLPVIRINE